MKTTALSILAIAGFSILFSCKNEVKDTEENQAVVTDSIPQSSAPKSLYVTAVSGLTLREHPNLQSKKLVVMPLGTKVNVINPEPQTTMNVGGIDGAMDEIEYNNQTGYAFNGFMSKFPPPGANANAKNYAETLKNEFPAVEYAESTGGTVSKPTKTETLILPTDKWHEAFFTAQQLFEIPKEFAFPNPKGSNNETQNNSNKKKSDFLSDLQISRNSNQLQKIMYNYKTTGFGYTVTITQEGDRMKIEKTEVSD
ncbi:hypothetical protein EI546_12125 [Aequorivita sp. H23M31]|uniref:SH3b domain-containing protein n=1 Tax=Aequorivita ciconiae TaxID=2494375 RepID=A0A410G585_9FLAO|nr:SH3 domain-containing protein [Aequorivita sp. H23M31]QAA82419.1 hypothetical protein EI546_12125 [Aequorivita sp. H23M31]